MNLRMNLEVRIGFIDLEPRMVFVRISGSGKVRVGLWIERENYGPVVAL